MNDGNRAKFTLNGVDSISIPSDGEIQAAIASLKSESDSFAILGTDAEFVQCYLGVHGKVVLEWRNRSGLYRAGNTGLTLDRVAAAFLGFKHHVDGWSSEFTWSMSKTQGTASLPRLWSCLQWVPAVVGVLLFLAGRSYGDANVVLQKTGCVLISASLLLENIAALKTGCIRSRPGSVSREDSPFAFWLLFVVYGLGFVLLCVGPFTNQFHFGK